MRNLFLCLFMLTTYALNAEIEQITLEWDNVLCKDDCAARMQKELSKVSEISNVAVSQSNGMATMQWKAEKRFSFPTIDKAIKKIGLHVQALRVKVRGTITEQNRKFYITSIGDGTKFNLLGAASDNPTKNRYVVQQSRYNRPLSQEQKAILMEAIKKELVVVIEGPIYQPYQFPPLDLIIGSINIAKPATPNKKS